MASRVISIFVGLCPNAVGLCPNAMVSSTAVVLLPFVLACQAWNYCVFRLRISAQEFAPRSSAAGEVG
jgi:hypothetical protein